MDPVGPGGDCIRIVGGRRRYRVDAPTRVTLDESSVQRLGLTIREAEVLTLVAVGRTNRQIGEELYVSDKTASVHVSNILRKLGFNSRSLIAAWVTERRLVEKSPSQVAPGLRP